MQINEVDIAYLIEKKNVKFNIVLRWWNNGEAFKISLYDQGRIEPTKEASPVRSTPDVMHLVYEVINKVRDRLKLLHKLEFGDPVGDHFILTIEFFPPAGGRKKPLITFKLFRGGDVKMEENPLILPMPGLDRPGVEVLIPDEVICPLVISMLQFVSWSIQKNPVFVLASAGGVDGASERLDGLDEGEGLENEGSSTS